MHTHYTQYYLTQSGRGISDIGNIYKSPGFYQTGRGGIGSFFSGLFRNLKPLVSSGFSALKEQSIKTGKDILSEIGQKPFKQILKEQGKVAATELTQRGIAKLKRKMQKGQGEKRKKKSTIKRVAKRKKNHFRTKHRPSKKVARKKLTGQGRKRRKKTSSGIRSKKTRFVDIFDNNNNNNNNG